MPSFELEEKFWLPKSSISSALSRMSIEQLRYCREILEKGKYLMLCQVVLKLMILELISALKTGEIF